MDRLSARRRQGFSLIELMLTLTVLAFGFVAISAMQIQALQGGAKGRHRTGASMVAQDQIEMIQRMSIDDAALDIMDPVAWANPPWISGGNGLVTVSAGTNAGTDQIIQYQVWYTVDEDPSGNEFLRQVNLEVVWSEEGMTTLQTRTGKPTVAVSTLLVDTQ